MADSDDETGDDDGDDGIEALLSDPRYYELAAESDDISADTEDDEPEPSSRREARYRAALRAAEQRLEVQAAEIGHLQDQIKAMRKEEVERIAGRRLADGADLWAGGVQLDDLLDSDGRLDQALLDKAIDAVLQRRPQAGVRTPRGQLHSGASNRPDAPTQSKWAAAFSPRSE